MKTEKSKTKVEVSVFKDMNSNTSGKQGKKIAPGIKTEAFGDKENLLKKTKISYTNDNKPKLTDHEDTTKDKKAKIIENEEITKEKTLKKITAEDLTSEAGPSEAYWETLAEKRRKALEEALKENSILHEKIELLQKENETFKQALAEATEVIDVLNEIIAEDKFQEEESNENLPEDTDQNDENKVLKSPTNSVFGDESTILNDSDDSLKESD